MSRPNALQVGAFGCIAIPDVQSDVLSSFGEDNRAMYIARVGMGFVSSAISKLPFPRKKSLSTGNPASLFDPIFQGALVF
jgi:hypothetical protein